MLVIVLVNGETMAKMTVISKQGHQRHRASILFIMTLGFRALAYHQKSLPSCKSLPLPGHVERPGTVLLRTVSATVLSESQFAPPDA